MLPNHDAIRFVKPSAPTLRRPCAGPAPAPAPTGPPAPARLLALTGPRGLSILAEHNDRHRTRAASDGRLPRHERPFPAVNIISLTGVTKTLADLPLFEDVTLGIDAGERIGFVGRNGCGKSTFLRVLQGDVEPDRGSVARNRALKISTAEQRPVVAPAMKLDEFLFQDREALKSAGAETVAAVVNTYRSYCRELGMEDPEARMGTFSGGMIRKAVLARCLAFGAGFLTLDEPTNHLDLDTIEWLESLLRGASFGFLLVTHDRRFLDAVCTSIM